MTSSNSSDCGPDRDSRQPDDQQFELDYTGVSDALSTTEKFELFHQLNPHIYDLLVQLSRQWIRDTGRPKLGVAQLWERMRWDLAVRSSATDFRLNNDYKAYYARLIMKRESDLADLFDLRKSEADNWIGQVAA